MLKRYFLYVVSALSLSLFTVGPAVAQQVVGGFGSTTVEYKFITNHPVGASGDIMARKIVQLLRDRHNISAKVYNLSGGAGLQAATEFKKERLAIGFANTSSLAYLPVTLPKVDYTRQDFDIVYDVGISGVVWFATANSGINNLDDLKAKLPTIPKASIAIGAGDGRANARAFLKSQGIDVPVVTFKSNADAVIQVAGGHVPVGVVTLTASQVWTMAEEKKTKLLGVVSKDPLTYKGFTVPSINQKFGHPVFPGGLWLAMTPGNTQEHKQIRSALLSVMKDPEIQAMEKQDWPMGKYITLDEIIDIAKKNSELLK
jgi:tripartite-type tricarboxylate transporter receptor subunit TctC